MVNIFLVKSVTEPVILNRHMIRVKTNCKPDEVKVHDGKCRKKF